MPLYIAVLIMHGVLGALDVFVSHEWLARLPARRAARTEEALHSVREALFGLVFLALAWREWHGAAVWWIAVLVLGEAVVSTLDALVEGETRVLPRVERVLHVLLYLNLGMLLLAGGGVLADWHAMPTAIVPVDHGRAGWLLGALGCGALAWSVRDGRSARRLAVISKTNHSL